MEYASAPTVVYQRPRSQKGYIETTVDAGKKVTDLFRGVSNWVRGTEPPPPVEQPDQVKITCAKFVELQLVPNKITPCLLFGSNKGYEIWDLSHVGKEQAGGTEKITELVCQTVGPVLQIYALSDGNGAPSIAYVLAEDPKKLIVVRGLGDGVGPASFEITDLMNPSIFGEDIVNVLSNQRAIVVVGCTQCVVLHPESWQARYKIPIYQGLDDREQQIDTTGCVTLGSRFLAFQSQPGPRRRRISNGLHSSSLQGSLLQSAAAAATSAKFLVSGTETRESPPGGGEITIVDLEAAIREEYDFVKRDQTESTLIDVCEGGQVTAREEPIENHFRIISKFVVEGGQALSSIQFDPSGALLAAAIGNGTGLAVYPVNCQSHYKPTTSSKPILNLSRGVTAAVIKHISFSHDSSLVECVSNHRTTHIWAPRADLFENTLCNLSAPTPTEKLKSSSLSKEPFTAFGGVNYFLPRDGPYYKMLNFDDSGILSLYCLKVSLTTDTQGKTSYQWEIIPSKHEWNLLESVENPAVHRKRRNYIFRAHGDNANIQHSIFRQDPGGGPYNSHWYSEVEYETCDISLDKPSWKNPAMTIKINRQFDDRRFRDAPLIPYQESIFAKLDWEDVSSSPAIPGMNNGAMDDLGISKFAWPNPN